MTYKTPKYAVWFGLAFSLVPPMETHCTGNSGNVYHIHSTPVEMGLGITDVGFMLGTLYTLGTWNADQFFTL